MKRVSLIYILVAGIVLYFSSCSEDIGIKDFTFQCQTNNDCKEGYVCDKVKGCIRIVKDAGADVADIIDVPGLIDIADIEDAGGDIEDTGDAPDAYDAGDAEEISDISDGGVDVQNNYILRLDSLYDPNAGICSSPNYILESVTGFTASDEMKNSKFILHRSMFFNK
ncbi:MAG: hypothetical protein N3B13_03100 [Deltaproteobacteria bacterium]|nr:hypothetical protein [Deltaproteobacteria bacterium]